MYPNVHSNIIYDCLDMEANLVSINRCMDKEELVCILTWNIMWNINMEQYMESRKMVQMNLVPVKE